MTSLWEGVCQATPTSTFSKMSSRRGGSKGQASRSSLAQRPRAVATDLDRLRKNEVEYKAKIKMVRFEWTQNHNTSGGGGGAWSN